MAIFDFINNFIVKKEGIKEYDTKLKLFLTDGQLSDIEKEELESIKAKYALDKNDLVKLQSGAFNQTFNAIAEDERITDNEVKSLEALLKYFDLDKSEVSFNQEAFNKYYTLALIDKGILPEISEGNRGINIIFKPEEKVHSVVHATLHKMKKVTTRVQFHGLTSSIRIMKGLRYRTGSYKIATQSSDFLAKEDSGMFYLTSMQIGFIGSKKQFSVPYDKINMFELRSDGLYIFKQGKETPYIVSLHDYELPLAVLSFVINK